MQNVLNSVVMIYFDIDNQSRY